MPRRKIRVLVAVLVLISQLLVLTTSVMQSAYALGSPVNVQVDVNIDLSSARGFEKVGRTFYNIPEFVLGRGKTGELNITFTSLENKDSGLNETFSISSAWYGGNAATNYSHWSGVGRSLPDGITASIEPQNLTITPGAHATVTMQISIAPDTAIRSYNLSFSFIMNSKRYGDLGVASRRETVLTIVEGAAPSITNTTKSTTTLCVNNTVTATVTSTQTVTVTTSNSTTQTMTTTAATPNLSITNPLTTTPDTLTSTITATSTEGVADPSTYIWAVSATVAAVVLAVVLLLQRRSA